MSRPLQRSDGTSLAIDGHDMDAILVGGSTRPQSTPGSDRQSTWPGQSRAKASHSSKGKPGWHGKPLKQVEEANRAIAELERQFVPEELPAAQPRPRSVPRPARKQPAPLGPPSYALGEKVATREAFGTAIARLGASEPFARAPPRTAAKLFATAIPKSLWQ